MYTQVEICRQLLAASPHADTHRGSGLGSRWGLPPPDRRFRPPPLIISKPATAVCGINAFTAQGGDAHKSWEITLFGVFTDAEPASAPLSHARDYPACSKRRSFAHVYTQRRVTRGTDILSPSNHRKIASTGLHVDPCSQRRRGRLKRFQFTRLQSAVF